MFTISVNPWSVTDPKNSTPNSTFSRTTIIIITIRTTIKVHTIDGTLDISYYYIFLASYMNELTLACGVIFYQDAKGLKRLNDSVNQIPYLSKIYAIDGRFVYPTYGNDKDSPLSTDLDSLPKDDKLNIISCGNTTEWQKRQRYLEECYKDKPDFLLIVDTDEILQVNLEEFEEHLQEIKEPYTENPGIIYHNVYDVRFDDKTQRIKNLKPRLWFRPSQMEYTDYMAYRNKQYIHYHTDPSGSMFPHPSIIIRGITIVHDKTLRSKEWEIKNREYHKRQITLPIV